MNTNAADRDEPISQLKTLFVALVVSWSVVIVGFAAWSYWQSYAATLAVARASAYESFSKDLVYRRWATMHGGVYAAVTPETPPNPYLSDIPERDITTASGKQLTLINPAYMTRQVHQLAEKAFGSKGHITSLNPLRPENTPDAWEKRALEAFAQGEKEVSSVEQMGGETYVRYMRPLIAEAGCLKCHARQGYKAGDIRGGLSVSVPWDDYRKALRAELLNHVFGYGAIWAIGILGLGFGRNRIRDQLVERRRQDAALRRLNEELEQKIVERTRDLQVANAELESFSYSVSHDLRAPLRAIEGFSSLLEKEYAEQLDERAKDYFRRVRGGATRMAVLIDDLLQLSRISRQEMHRASVDLSALARDAAAVLQEAEPQRRVEWVIAPDMRAQGDPGLLRIVLQNLIDNAWKYSSKRDIARIEFGVGQWNGQPAFFVRDNGEGFDMAYEDKLFGPFQRLHSAVEFPGTGIGLATVARIIRSHGGTVGAEGKVHEGATFYFTL